MAKGRMLSRTLGASKKFAEVNNHVYRLVYCLILPHLDCKGRYTADPTEINAYCLTRLGFTVEQTREALAELARVKLIRLYTVNGNDYLEYVDFSKHNTPYRYEKPEYPEPQKEEKDELASSQTSDKLDASKQLASYKPIGAEKSLGRQVDEQARGLASDKPKRSAPIEVEVEVEVEVEGKKEGLASVQTSHSPPTFADLLKTFIPPQTVDHLSKRLNLEGLAETWKLTELRDVWNQALAAMDRQGKSRDQGSWRFMDYLGGEAIEGMNVKPQSGKTILTLDDYDIKSELERAELVFGSNSLPTSYLKYNKLIKTKDDYERYKGSAGVARSLS
jgi:hypothetical protein